MRKKLFKVAAVVFALVLAATPITASAAWDRLEFDTPSTSSSAGRFTPSTKVPYGPIQTQIKEAQATNSDVIGWLKVPGTNIDEPIVMNKSVYDYYLYRDWKGTLYNGLNWQNWSNFPNTATYLDYRSSFSGDFLSGTSKNLVLYGHNWTNLRTPLAIGNQPGHEMFAQLPSYTNVDFAKQNGHIYFSSGENEGIWRVFSVAYCEISTDFFYNKSNPSTEEYQKLLNEWKQRSVLNFDVDVNTNDRIITLSTCTRVYGNASEGGAGDYQRYVVVARLLRDGESESDVISVTENPNYKRPQF